MAEDLLTQLQRWGLVKTFVPGDDSKPARSQHLIERKRKFAPMTRKRLAKKLAKRDGGDRRRIVAKAACVHGMGIVPKWSNDPIRCTETRGGGPTSMVEKINMPPELQWIDRALTKLAERSPILSLVIREEFTGRGVSQKDRAADARQKYGGELSYWQYRRELESAMAYLEGFRSAA